ncbi:MAG: HEAT repeat domain-containing protein [Phycisphaerales bacterium]|nr:HEAT repeat domain-containing protein [Phycisphaerales bacterium]
MAALLAVAAAGLHACAPPVSEGGFDAPDPASQAYAIERAARSDDRSSLPSIVEALDSDDPAVRFLAINTLESMTGTTRGYLFYDPAEAREAAVERWVQWLRATGLDDTEARRAARANSPGVGVHDG